MQKYQLVKATESNIPALIEVFETGISFAANSNYKPKEIQAWLKTLTTA